MADLAPRRKHKSLSIILAIFLGPWTWLYTFGRDSWKLALGLGLTTNTLAIFIWLRLIIRQGGIEFHRKYPEGIYDAGVALVIPFLILVTIVSIVWLWSLLDSIIKPASSLTLLTSGYNKDKGIALIIALITGPWVFLYLNSKYLWPFFLGLILLYGIPNCVVLAYSDSVDLSLSFYPAIIVWLASIVCILFIPVRPELTQKHLPKAGGK